ncbi:MAG: SRPBCC domain-containing protein [Oceanococcus sp.]|nr:MAG: SRPBCC domain-containing protein [Oceanococcus sp.]
MPVVNVSHDLETLTLSITAEFAAPVQRIWALYADPRQLERVWGPPSHPATFVDHCLKVGAKTTYYMTGPEGEKYYGYWVLTKVDEPHGFEFDDGFANAEFEPNLDMPVSKNVYRFEAIASGTRATYIGTYASREGLEQVLAMGIVEGATSAINQIDALVSG